MISEGLVVAVSQAAADAGARALAAGGNAVDAAVAAGFALCVVDSANCGLGGYGGFLTYLPPEGDAVEVDFNTWAPDRLDPAGFRRPGDISQSLVGGAAVAPPVTVPGLLTALERLGRLAPADVIADAVALARDGFPVGRELARALAEHWQKRDGGRPELAAVYYPDGRPPEEGARLVQPELARTLEAIARDGAAAFRSGALVDAICAAAQADGGFLEPDDFLRDAVTVGPAETVSFGSAVIAGPPRATSGTGVLFSALAGLEPSALGENRSRAYIDEVARALLAAWDVRSEATSLARQSPNTTNLCTADPEGGIVTLTFTHGPWFGSGVVVEGTGMVLNAGANLFAVTADGARAVTNMAPLVVRRDDGTSYAVGGTGGPRIPALLLTAVVDVVHHGLSLGDALAAPHVSVRALERSLEVEPELLDVAGDAHPMGIRDYGPAAGLTRTTDGCVAAVDPRFTAGVSSI